MVIRVFKTSLLILILAVLALPSLHSLRPVIPEPALKGFYPGTAPPSARYFTWHRWFSGTFQDTISHRVSGTTGFRKTFIRIRNQYDYSFFRIIHADGFVAGRDRYLFEEDYIHEYTGAYFIGKAALDKKLSRLKNASDSLRAHGVELFLVFEPGKASFYPEYIPSRFKPGRRTMSNYEYMTARCREMDIPVLDLNRWFLMMKDTSPWPLFPRYGMHWSLYGVPFAVDTLTETIEQRLGITLPGFAISQLETSSTPQGTDNDIGEMLNLLCPPGNTPGAYPRVEFRTDAPPALHALVVADSYYINIVEPYGTGIFAKQEYWYYNNKLYPYQNNSPPVYVDKSGLRDKLLGFDVVLLMVSEINLHCGFWNFADEAFLAFHPGMQDPHLYRIENEIRNDREWFRFVLRKARLQGRSLEDMIRSDAGYTFVTQYDNLSGKGRWDSVWRVVFEIRDNPDWFDRVRKKAEDLRISVDSMLLLDAIYTYDNTAKNH